MSDPDGAAAVPPLQVRWPVLDLKADAAAAAALAAAASTAAATAAAAPATASDAKPASSRSRPAAVAAPATLALVDFQVVVYNGALHCWTRREQWPVLAGSRATLQDVWSLVRSNRAQEDVTGRVHFERVRVDSIAAKADAQAIDWHQCALTDSANDVLSQCTFLQFAITDLNELEGGDAEGDDDDGDGDGAGEEGGGSNGSTVTATAAAGALAAGDVGLLDARRRGAARPVYRGYTTRRGARNTRGGGRLPEADPTLPPDAPLLCGGRARWVTLALLLVLTVIYVAYCLRLFVVYRPLAAHCGAFDEFACVHNATDRCWEYAGDCYPNDPAYTAAEAAGFGFAFLTVALLFLAGSSAFGSGVARSWCVCTCVWSVMACAFVLVSAHFSWLTAQRAADAVLLPPGWTHLMNVTAWLLPVTVAVWINRGTVFCPC